MQTVPAMRKILFGIVFLFAGSQLQAGPVAIPGMPGGDIMFNVTSKQEAKFRKTMRQQYDFSCGSAALATLLSSGYEDSVSEGAVFQRMYEVGDKAKIRKEGFSLLDMKKYLETIGYEADGYRTTLDRLVAVGVPAITILNMKGYHHFVVIKGVTGKEILVSDPMAGSIVIPRSEFDTMWNGILFMIRNRKNVAVNHFNQEEEWKIRVKAPFGPALGGNELANFTMFVPRPLQ